MQWFRHAHRPMPWKGEKDPYRIWLSEVILQQTRVQQGWDYYERFIRTFPTVLALAQSTEEEVIILWEGLGYYSRARNLHRAARIIINEFNGKLPDDYNLLKTLPGIGPYTAAAIASFAFSQPVPVIDGNVVRILSRYFGIEKPFGSANERKTYQSHAEAVLDPRQPGTFNQAIMDFGALVCIPAGPRCAHCPVHARCFAFANNLADRLPPRPARKPRKSRYFHYVVMLRNGYTYIRKRTGNDIWKHLWEFPLIETDRLLDDEALKRDARIREWLNDNAHWEEIYGPYRQVLTHQKITATFAVARVTSAPGGDLVAVKTDRLHEFAFPKTIHAFLSGKVLHL